MSGDTYKRRPIEAPGVFQCGCFWRRADGWGDVLFECPIHKAATKASVDKFERERVGA